MKNFNYVTWLLFCSVLAFTANNLQAQTYSDSTLTLKQLLQDYAVPDAPAFVVLQEYPSTILRPSSVRAVAVSASDFLGQDATITLPSNFALEVSPGLLIGGNDLTLAEYRDAPLLYRTRLSVGTDRENSQTGASSLAIGLRIPLIDQTDLRTNDAILDKVNAYATQILSIRIAAGGDPRNPEPDQLSPQAQSSIDSLKSLINTSLAQTDNMQDTLWNQMMLDLAFAVAGSSPDSLAKDLKVDNYSAWLTFAAPIGTWGQVFLGGHFESVRMLPVTEFTTSVKAAARLYIGTNSLKTYFEAQGEFLENSTNLLLTGGAELRIFDGIWIECNAGANVSEASGSTDIVSSFRVKFGT